MIATDSEADWLKGWHGGATPSTDTPIWIFHPEHGVHWAYWNASWTGPTLPYPENAFFTHWHHVDYHGKTDFDYGYEREPFGEKPNPPQ